MKWTCQSLSEEKNQLADVFYQPKTKSVKVDYFTLGQITKWQCRGDSPVDKSLTWNLAIKEEGKEKLPSYNLEQLTWIDEKTIELNLRFYKVQKTWPFLLVNKEQEIPLEGIEPNIGSVLEYHDLKQESAEPQSEGVGSLQTTNQPQPYPIISGISLSYPIIFWLLLAILFSIITYFSFKKWRTHLKLKKFRSKLKENFIATSAVQNFYKDMRAIYRDKNFNQEYIDKLKNAYKDYIMYRFKLPVKEWPNKIVYTKLKKEQQNLSETVLRETYSYLQELDKISLKDSADGGLKNFIHDLQNNVEDIERELK